LARLRRLLKLLLLLIRLLLRHLLLVLLLLQIGNLLRRVLLLLLLWRRLFYALCGAWACVLKLLQKLLDCGIHVLRTGFALVNQLCQLLFQLTYTYLSFKSNLFKIVLKLQYLYLL